MAWPLSLFTAADTRSPSPGPATPSTPTASPVSPVSPVYDLLRHFEAPGLSLPPSSRVGDPKLKQKEGQPMRLWQFWKYGTFAAMKGQYPALRRRVATPTGWSPDLLFVVRASLFS